MERQVADQIEQLEAAGDWRRAAELAQRHGAWEIAEALYLQLLDHAAAGAVAERAGVEARALGHYLRAGAQDHIERLYQKMLSEMSPDLPGALRALQEHGRAYQAAEVARALGQLEQAAALYEAGQSPLEAALLLERLGRWRRAGELYAEVVAHRPDSCVGNLGLGRVMQRLELHEEACNALWRASSVGAGENGQVHAAERSEARARMAYSLAQQGLEEAARCVLSTESARTADTEATLEQIRQTYQPGSGGVSARYTIKRDLSGPAGESYGAWDTARETEVVLVPLTGPGPRRAAWRSAQEQLSSPPLPGVLALVDVDPAQRYAVFEGPGGPSLAELLEAGVLDGPQLGSLARQLVQVLAGAHGRGVLHGSLSPWSIFVRPGGAAVVTGFEQSQLGWQSETATTLGGDNPLSYLAPEVALGAPGDYRSDFYGLGATLWRAVTGTSPPAERSGAWLAEVPVDWRSALSVLVAAEPLQRPQSHGALEALVRGCPWAALSRRIETAELARGDAEPAGISAGMVRYALVADASDPVAGCLFRDEWLGRDLERVGAPGPLDAATQARLRLLAQPDAPGLQPILAVDGVRGQVHLVRLSGRPMSECGEVDLPRLARILSSLRCTLAWLHRHGQAYGALTARDVMVDTEAVFLRLGRRALQADEGATVAGDLEALSALARSWLTGREEGARSHMGLRGWLAGEVPEAEPTGPSYEAPERARSALIGLLTRLGARWRPSAQRGSVEAVVSILRARGV